MVQGFFESAHQKSRAREAELCTFERLYNICENTVHSRLCVIPCFMTPITTHQNHISTADSRRQLEESIGRAMERYRSDFEAVREKSARLRAEREALETEHASTRAAGKSLNRPPVSRHRTAS